MTVETIEQRIVREMSRGAFAYWEPRFEAEWRAEAPHAPVPPRLTGCQRISVAPSNWPRRRVSEWSTWEASLNVGRSYLVGNSVPMGTFIAKHRSELTDWQREAFVWAGANPFYKLKLSTPGKEWEVYLSGEMVEFALPHHDYGGERHYISRDGKNKVLINED